MGEETADPSRHRQVVVAEIDDRRIGIQAQDVVEVQRAAAVTALPGAPPSIDGVLDLRGELIAVLDGRAHIGASRRPPRLSDRFVVVQTSTRTMAVRVDAVLTLAEIVVVDPAQTSSLAAETLQDFGLARMDDGLLVIHDVETFLSSEDSARLDRALARQQQP